MLATPAEEEMKKKSPQGVVYNLTREVRLEMGFQEEPEPFSLTAAEMLLGLSCTFPSTAPSLNI